MREFFKGAIQKDPYDMDIRKVYADWLEENGDGAADDDLAAHHRSWTVEKQESTEWLQKFLDELYREELEWREKYEEPTPYMMSVEELLAQAVSGGMICLSFDTPDICWKKIDEFWEHVEVLTGYKCCEDDDYVRYLFRCAC